MSTERGKWDGGERGGGGVMPLRAHCLQRGEGVKLDFLRTYFMDATSRRQPARPDGRGAGAAAAAAAGPGCESSARAALQGLPRADPHRCVFRCVRIETTCNVYCTVSSLCTCE